MQLLLEVFTVRNDVLGDVAVVHRLLEELPVIMGMHKIIEPCVVTYVGSKPEDWGVSGFVMIAESHISVHTFAKHGYAEVDVFSCRPFEVETVVAKIAQVLHAREIDQILVGRGLEYVKGG